MRISHRLLATAMAGSVALAAIPVAFAHHVRADVDADATVRVYTPVVNRFTNRFENRLDTVIDTSKRICFVKRDGPATANCLTSVRTNIVARLRTAVASAFGR